MNKRQKKEIKYAKVKARLREVEEKESLSDRPSDWGIKHLKDLPPNSKCISLLRVSYCTQERNKNLDDQQQNLLDEVASLNNGSKVVGYKRHVGSGFDPGWIASAVKKAIKYKAVFITESTDRLVRPIDYHSKYNPNAQADGEGLQAVVKECCGIDVYTVVHPDASPEEVRSYQRKRGIRMKKEKKKDGYRKRKKLELLPIVLQLHEEGLSLRQIHARTGVTVPTIQNWLRENRSSLALSGHALPEG